MARTVGHDRDIDVTYRLLKPTDAARGLDAPHVRVAAQQAGDVHRGRHGVDQQQAIRALDGALGLAEDALLQLRANAGHRLQQVGPRGLLQLRDRRDAEALVEHLRPLRADARHVEQIGRLDGELKLQLLVVAELARFEILRNLRGDRRADALDFLEPALTPEAFDILAQPRDALGGLHVGANAIAGVALDRQQPSDVLDQLGDLFVAPRHRSPPYVHSSAYVLTQNGGRCARRSREAVAV